MRFPITDGQQHWPYLLPFLKYGQFFVEKRTFIYPPSLTPILKMFFLH